MNSGNEQLPKKVVKLVKKLADLQRKQIEIMRWRLRGEKTPEELKPVMDEQIEKAGLAASVAELKSEFKNNFEVVRSQ